MHKRVKIETTEQTSKKILLTYKQNIEKIFVKKTN